MNRELYDPACMRFDTAIRAVWILYRRGKWRELETLGLNRSECEPIFQQFDMECIFADNGLIKTESETFELIMRCPAVAQAANDMVLQYTFKYGMKEQKDETLSRLSRLG
ncbi:hypothetical protein KSX_27110 [Ktedonospora formicarum]|uniref:Uncharacterized protein n=1 Tax=Ktedonospora formicarum TaxID=2778364 RepID=A0A8J3MSE9_9CHLR|nr:hypothetical protein KSX_27110 [Ktedonospora formicarum]